MAKQTFTTGQVLTAAQMTSLQQTAMGGGSATAKTANYVLVADDAGTTVIMNAAGATTITVNTSLFSAGDTVFIQNIGAGVSTITAGTATVSTASSLALAQYESGNLYFTATGASIFSKAAGAAAGGGGKVLQVVSATTSTATTIASTTFTDTTLTASITPTAATSKILILTTQQMTTERGIGQYAQAGGIKLLRGATVVYTPATIGFLQYNTDWQGSGEVGKLRGLVSLSYLDSPATTSATTYKTQGAVVDTSNSGQVKFQHGGADSVGSIILMEIGA
jgi:hypothetical protein